MIQIKFTRADGQKPKGLRKRAAPHKTEFSRDLRKAPTRSEAQLWERLRCRRCLGYKFRRQQIILGWIADFWCPELRLVVEVDGSSHWAKQSKDEQRDRAMQTAAISVLRLPASLVECDTDIAVAEIKKAIRELTKDKV